MSIEVFTVATERNEGFLRFSSTLAAFGVTPIIRGMGEFFPGYGWRFKKLAAAARESAADVILFADSFDSVCLESPLLAAQRFAALQHPIVFSFEPQRQPEPYLALNAGLMIAQRTAFLDVFTDRMLDELFPDHFNDQIQLQALLSWEPDLFRLDVGSQIFFTSLRGESYRVGSTPVFVHAPYGGSLDWLKPRLESIYAQAS